MGSAIVKNVPQESMLLIVGEIVMGRRHMGTLCFLPNFSTNLKLLKKIEVYISFKKILKSNPLICCNYFCLKKKNICLSLLPCLASLVAQSCLVN